MLPVSYSKHGFINIIESNVITITIAIYFGKKMWSYLRVNLLFPQFSTQ